MKKNVGPYQVSASAQNLAPFYSLGAEVSWHGNTSVSRHRWEVEFYLHLLPWRFVLLLARRDPTYDRFLERERRRRDLSA